MKDALHDIRIGPFRHRLEKVTASRLAALANCGLFDPRYISHNLRLIEQHPVHARVSA